MVESRPSRTAWRVALRRAAHQVLDTPVVFRDPLALRIVGTDEISLRADARTVGQPALRAFLAVRSRCAEDQLAAAVARGATQYVVLGAGLDTFAFRNACPGLRVFEIDHPATQAWKREQLARTGIAIPASLTFVPVDFETRKLRDELQRAGFRFDRITFFSWLGVVPYLTLEAFEATMSLIACRPPGSGVTFDYALTGSELSVPEKLALASLSARVAAAGEPFQLFFAPPALAASLRYMGFRTLEDLGPAEIAARYFQGSGDGSQKSAGLAHLMTAVT